MFSQFDALKIVTFDRLLRSATRAPASVTSVRTSDWATVGQSADVNSESSLLMAAITGCASEAASLEVVEFVQPLASLLKVAMAALTGVTSATNTRPACATDNGTAAELAGEVVVDEGASLATGRVEPEPPLELLEHAARNDPPTAIITRLTRTLPGLPAIFNSPVWPTFVGQAERYVQSELIAVDVVRTLPARQSRPGLTSSYSSWRMSLLISAVAS